MEHDAYETFAERYDRFFVRFGEHGQERVDFFRNLFSGAGVRRVLDCACGTGHDLVLLAALGVEATGSDASAAMLARARRNLAERHLDVPLEQVDFRELPSRFSNPFDAVLCLSTSFCHVPNEAEALRALGSMRDVLRPGGLLILTQGTSDKQWAEQHRFFLVASVETYSRVLVVDYLGKGARFTVLDILHGAGGGSLETWSVEYPQVFLRDDYERLLGAAGFSEVRFFGSFLSEPYDCAASDHLIVVATR